MSLRRLQAGAALAVMAAVLGLGSGSPAQQASFVSQAPLPSINLYGESGIIDMPGALVQPDGQMIASFSTFGTTTRRNFTFQLLPRVSGTLRYSSISDWDRPADPTYEIFDRSVDLKFQLLNERPGWQPSLALAFRDFLGTGVYSAEYLVASKTIAKNFIVTGGLGWGRLASANALNNPLCSLSAAMCKRDDDYGNGGTIAWNRFFRGENMGVFGGVEWRTWDDKLSLKAEVSSDDYTREQASPELNFERRSPFNFGAEYRIRPGITLGGYYMYGDTLGLNIVLSGNPMKPPVPQNLGQGPLPVNPRPADANRSTAWASDPKARQTVINAIGKALDDEELTLEEIKLTGTTVDVMIVNRLINEPPKAIGRAARILALGMPYSVETFRITPVESGLPTTTVTINRTEFENQINRPNASGQSWATAGIKSGVPVLSGGDVWKRDVYPLTSWAVIPLPSIQFFGGTDGFKPQLSAEFRGSVRVTRGLSFSAQVRQPILGIYPRPRGRERAAGPAAGASPVEPLLCRLGAEADPPERGLSLQAQRRHLCACVRGSAQALVRRCQHRNPLEALDPELGYRRGTQLGRAARLLQPVRLWSL